MTSMLPDPAPGHARRTPPFLLSLDVVDARISVHGDLDRRHAHRLLEAVAVLARSDSPTWSIDVAAMTFCDLEGLRSLMEAQRLAQEAGRTLRVVRGTAWMHRLMRLVGLEALLPTAEVEPR